MFRDAAKEHNENPGRSHGNRWSNAASNTRICVNPFDADDDICLG